MKLSNIIGILSGVEEKVMVDDEVFFDTNLILNGKSLPARVPEYLSGVSGKCKICCSLESTERNSKLFTYVSVLTAERLKDQKTPEAREFVLSAKVQKVSVDVVPCKGTMSVNLRVSVLTGIRDTKISTIHVTATDKAARQLANVPEKSMIELTGTVRPFKGCLYFRTSTVVSVRKPDESC